MATHGLVEPFETEDLAGADAEFAFALGVEWAMFRATTQDGGAVHGPCDSTRRDRLVRMAERHGPFVQHHPHCDGWDQVIVGDHVCVSCGDCHTHIPIEVYGYAPLYVRIKS